MSVRFRIRTSAGQELSFATHEMFEDFVRSGDLSPDDLVYDREIGSWAPARTHPLVLEIEYENEEFAEGGAKAEESPSKADSPSQTTGMRSEEEADGSGTDSDVGDSGTARSGGDGDAFGLDLAPAAEMMSTDAAAQAFIEKMDAERETDSDMLTSDSGGMQGFTMENPDHVGGIVKPEVPREPPPKTPPPPPRRPSPRREAVRGDEATPSRSMAHPPQRPAERSRVGGKVLMAILALGVLGGGAYFGPQFVQRLPATATPDGDDGVDPVETGPVEIVPPPPAPEPVIGSAEPVVRERALERFLTSTQSLMRDLQSIPDVWPEREYLTRPSEHSDVLDIWQNYLATIRRVRAGDDDRYRVAYQAALDDAAVQGEAREIRLSAAMSDLAAVASLRVAHYDRVEALASAAIQSHTALLEVEGLILFDVTGTTGVRDGIGVATYGRDAATQLLLDQVLDLLSATLDGDGLGPGGAVNVREWVWDGFLDAVAN